MELEIINKLFLELAQVATARTAKEIALEREIEAIDKILWPRGKPEHYEPNRVVTLRARLRLKSK